MYTTRRLEYIAVGGKSHWFTRSSFDDKVTSKGNNYDDLHVAKSAFVNNGIKPNIDSSPKRLV